MYLFDMFLTTWSYWPHGHHRHPTISPTAEAPSLYFSAQEAVATDARLTGRRGPGHLQQRRQRAQHWRRSLVAKLPRKTMKTNSLWYGCGSKRTLGEHRFCFCLPIGFFGTLFLIHSTILWSLLFNVTPSDGGVFQIARLLPPIMQSSLHQVGEWYYGSSNLMDVEVHILWIKTASNLQREELLNSSQPRQSFSFASKLSDIQSTSATKTLVQLVC